MNIFNTQIGKILGHEPSTGEMKFYNYFDPGTFDKEKRFSRYSASRPLFLNVDDEHYMYVSNHTSKLRCCLDMATRQLIGSECYKHSQGTIMLGIAHPKNEKHLNARVNNYHIYLQSTSRQETSEALQTVSNFADHISLVRDETPWERLCVMCDETNTGVHLTASSQRLLKHFKNGLIYVVPEHQDRNFKNAVKDLNTIPAFIGKTLSYSIITLDNDVANFELPITALKQLFLLQNKYYPNKTEQMPPSSSEIEIDTLNEPKDILEQVLNLLKEESAQHKSKRIKFKDTQDLFIENFPLSSLSFTPNGLNQHTLSAIVSLYYKGLKPLALSFFAETSAEYPQEIDTSLNVIQKAAKLFGIPMANNCVIPGEKNAIKLFFICKKTEQQVPNTFQEDGEFICLLGDPNGDLRGSAYANILGYKDSFTPPGVMTATLGALVDIIEDCKEKDIITSANFIERGGLISTLIKASQHSCGATIYSERKGAEQLFFYGEHQAAALVSIKEKNLIDLARITSNFNLSSSTIGRVNSSGEIMINNKLIFKS